MFWLNLLLLGIEVAIAVSIARLVVKKPKEKMAAFIILIIACCISIAGFHHWIIKPSIKSWFAQKEMKKRLMGVPFYTEVNKEDLEAAHACFYDGQYEKAAEFYKKTLKSASEGKAELNYRIGLSHFMAGSFDEALVYWQEAKKQSPDIFEHRTFNIPTTSMAPTLVIGDYVICDVEYYRHRAPSRGDVIVFVNPKRKDKTFVGRIIGMPEEVIQIKGKETFINNSLFSDKYANFESPAEKATPQTLPPSHFGSLKIPKESYFILGDNRNNSEDSRDFGCVHKDLILGRALVIYASLSAKDKKESSRPERTGKIIE